MALKRTEGRTAFELQCRHSFSRLAQIPELGRLQFGRGDLTSKVAEQCGNKVQTGTDESDLLQRAELTGHWAATVMFSCMGYLTSFISSSSFVCT